MKGSARESHIWERGTCARREEGKRKRAGESHMYQREGGPALHHFSDEGERERTRVSVFAMV